jgi:hypothetical protein
MSGAVGSQQGPQALRAARPCRFHDLRHTFGTHVPASGKTDAHPPAAEDRFGQRRELAIWQRLALVGLDIDPELATFETLAPELSENEVETLRRLLLLKRLALGHFELGDGAAKLMLSASNVPNGESDICTSQSLDVYRPPLGAAIPDRRTATEAQRGHELTIERAFVVLTISRSPCVASRDGRRRRAR